MPLGAIYVLARLCSGRQGLYVDVDIVEATCLFNTFDGP
jgi:hypothetical protein